VCLHLLLQQLHVLHLDISLAVISAEIVAKEQTSHVLHRDHTILLTVQMLKQIVESCIEFGVTHRLEVAMKPLPVIVSHETISKDTNGFMTPQQSG
jgi:hypothetical protein